MCVRRQSVVKQMTTEDEQKMRAERIGEWMQPTEWMQVLQTLNRYKR